ncbi:non-ribosomal peptide synthetase, partial [Thermoactinomyces mirandus]
MGIKQQDILSLSPMQEAMLFHSLFDKGNSYFKQLVLKIEGDFSPQLFEKSLNMLIDRYEIFRTVFLYKKVQKPRQVILKERKTKIRYEDFSHLTDEEKEKKIRAWIRQDQTEPFDLLKDVLLRVTVLKTETRRYQVIFSTHHILMDGWCMGIVFEDLFEIYGKLKHNEPVPAGKVTQYREFIRWLEQQNQSEAMEYWKQYLSGYEEPVKVPGMQPVADGEYQLGELTLSLDEELTRELNKMARRHHLTLNNVFQTIWGVLLQRYNNTEDVVFGSVVSGRNKLIRDIEKMVGLFINTIPVRVRGSGEERFIDLAKRVQRSALASEPYDYVSLADTQEYTQAGNQLFDHIVVFENYAFDPGVFDKYSYQVGFTVTDARSTFDKTNYDFNVIVLPNEKLTILFQYNELACSKAYVEKLFGHFRHIAEQVIQQPEKLLKEIELVTETEKEQLLIGFNQTDADYPREKTIQEIFEEQVEKYPQQIAIKIGEEALTYKDLNEQANQLARVLRKNGVRRGQIVGLVTKRSLEMMIGMLAIVKAGGAYMPIDPEYPPDRKEFMLQDSAASVLLLQPGLNVPSSYQSEIIHLLPEIWTNEDRSNLSGVNQADDLLYVIYTSGSTGKPKGNLTSHRNVIRTVINNGYIEIHENDRLLQLSNYCFDGSTFDIYNALLNGATLVLVPNEIGIDFTRLSQLIREEKITVAFMTTSLFNTIVDLDLDCLGNLRKILFGGEKASVKHVQKAVRELGEHRLINGYGPTETTVFATTCSIDNSVLATGRVPIGKPLNNTRLYVLNGWGQLQPVGVPGELCISGDGVAKGYLNRPDLTRERFVEDPFNPGNHMYKTGDLVRWLPDGNIEYIERMDDQVKIRGNRIEIGEVELRLLSHPKVLHAVVVADKDENGHSYLGAYVVPEQDVSHLELRDYMSETLPDYMVPDYFVKMDQLPLTPNGKVDRKALPKPSEARKSEREFVAPANPVEEKLVEIWQGVLGVDQISIHDDFFESGGHSLKAMVLSSQVNKQFNVDLPLREIFSRPTVQKQAAYIQMCHQKEYAEIPPAPAMEFYPVSSAQKRLYMVGQLEGMGTGYNMPYVFRVHGSLPVKRLENALQSLIVRHESLRTSFHLIEGELKQKIHPDATITIEHYQAEDESHGKQVIRQFIRPFDLEQAPLMRVGLLHRIDSEERFLLMDFHHIVADGVSIRILFQDLISLMKGEKLSPLALQYKDYAVWQQNVQQKEEWARHEKYWLNELSGELPVLDLPTDYPRPSVQQFEGDHLTFEFDSVLSEKLKRFCDKQKATLYMVLMAAYNWLLAKYSGQKDLIVGSPIAGRPHADLQSIVGMFANTLAVRSKLDPDLTFARFVGQVKEHILRMAEHQDYPFEELVEKLDIKRDLSRNPLFDTMFSMQNNDQSSFNFPGFSIELAEEWEWKKAKFDMSWMMVEDEKINGIVEYATHLYKTETIRKMIRDYIYLVNQVVENPDLRLGEMELVTPEEKQKLLQTFKG